MIISASRRTDIPAFFGNWFFNRIKEGFVLVKNPMNIYQISKIKLSPDVVDCIVFWTKNPEPIMDRLKKELTDKGYYFYFQYTITGYGKKLEPNVPLVNESIETFSKLSEAIGKEKVIWRYDPIIITDDNNFDYHKEKFDYIAKKLQGKTDKCVISFVDMYKKTEKNLKGIKLYSLSNKKMEELSCDLSKISKKYGIEMESCAEKIDLSRYGIKNGKCIDNKLIEKIIKCPIKATRDGQRDDCGCIKCIDIGAYHTCHHKCLYCYANYDHKTVENNKSKHYEDSPLLLGREGENENEKITDRKVESLKSYQGDLF